MHRLFWAGLLSAFCASVGAQTTEPVGDLLTEEEFLSVLDRSHPLVIERAEEVGLSQARAMSVARLDDPVIGVVREDPSGPVEQLDALLTWQLPPLSRGARNRSAELDIEAAEHRFRASLLDLRLAFREIYAEWALAAERERLLAAAAERVERLALREARRAEEGESAELDAARLRLLVSDLVARREQAASDRETARSAIEARFPTLPSGARSRLPEPPLLLPVTGDSPTVLAVRAEIESAREEGSAAGRFLSLPEIVLGWQRQEAGDDTVDGPVLGLGWTVPLFRRNQGERQAAEVRERSARARIEVLESDRRARAASARRVVERLRGALSDLSPTTSEGSVLLDAAEAAFVAGESTTTDLLETYRASLDARLARLDLHGRLLAAHRDLERWTTPSGDLVDIDPRTLESPP